MSFSPASKRSCLSAIPLALLLLVAACGDGDRPHTPTEPPFVHPGPNPTWEAIGEEAAGAVVGTLTWALENADAIESLGDWGPSTGSWRVATALPFGQPADLEVQFRNAAGSVRKHYVEGTTAEIRVDGQITSETSSTELAVRIYAIEGGGERALAEWSGSATSGGDRATFSGSADPVWRFDSLPLYVLDAGMSLRFGETTLFLAFYGNVVVGVYYYDGSFAAFNEFTFALQSLPGQG